MSVPDRCLEVIFYRDTFCVSCSEQVIFSTSTPLLKIVIALLEVFCRYSVCSSLKVGKLRGELWGFSRDWERPNQLLLVLCGFPFKAQPSPPQVYAFSKQKETTHDWWFNVANFPTLQQPSDVLLTLFVPFYPPQFLR